MNGDKEYHDPETIITVWNLPQNVRARDINDVFEKFGIVKNLSLRRRTARHSTFLLKNPYVVLVFNDSTIVDEIMRSRPFTICNANVFVRRYTPRMQRDLSKSIRTPVNIVVTPELVGGDIQLPGNTSMREYFSRFGKIERLERVDQYHAFIEFSDYDSVDVCTYQKSHEIEKQPICVYAYDNEPYIRCEIEKRSLKYSNNQTESMASFDGFHEELPAGSNEQEELYRHYQEKVHNLEVEHAERLAQLKAEWQQIVLERLKFEQLTRDLEQEKATVLQEMRPNQAAYSESIREKPQVKEEEQNRLMEALKLSAKKN